MSDPAQNTIGEDVAASQAGTSVDAAAPPVAMVQPNPDTQSAAQPISQPEPQPKQAVGSAGRRTGKRSFPPYTRSLLKVRVPVVVTLAEKKQKLGRILEIGPGQIIQFDKSCEEMLELEAGNCKIAAGEAVKVGDKFGLRIASIVPPDERFVAIKPNQK